MFLLIYYMLVTNLLDNVCTELTNSLEVILESPQLTNWGKWGDMDLCPNGTYATAIQLKSQSNQGGDVDDSGSTGTKLFCTNLSLRVCGIIFNLPKQNTNCVFV